MPEVIIRDANVNDLDSIYLMICQLEEEKLDKTHFNDTFTRNLSNPNIFYAVAVYENKTVGFISLHVQSLLHHSGNVAEIEELFVDPSMRGKGIGKKLVEHAKTIAKKQNCEVFEVSCNVRREKSHIFYQNEGLSKTHYKFTENLTQ